MLSLDRFKNIYTSSTCHKYFRTCGFDYLTTLFFRDNFYVYYWIKESSILLQIVYTVNDHSADDIYDVRVQYYMNVKLEDDTVSAKSVLFSVNNVDLHAEKGDTTIHEHVWNEYTNITHTNQLLRNWIELWRLNIHHEDNCERHHSEFPMHVRIAITPGHPQHVLQNAMQKEGSGLAVKLMRDYDFFEKEPVVCGNSFEMCFVRWCLHKYCDNSDMKQYIFKIFHIEVI
jgi:hypothetical protein